MPGFDVTPSVAAGRQLIQAYGERRFRIAGEVYEGSVLVFAERTVLWQAPEESALAVDHFEPVFAAPEKPEILVVGCGARFDAPPKGLRAGLKDKGLVLEWMDSRAACRTFNVLLTEGRPAAAAILAIA